MRILANILTDRPFPEKEMYNIVSRKDQLIEGLPTLVIGWDFTKSMYPEAQILEWEIHDGVYWTFGSRERRAKFEGDIVNFRKIAIKNFVETKKYVFLNILTAEKSEKSEILRYARGGKGIVYLNGGMLYIYSEEDSTVYGISLRDIVYGGNDYRKILSILHNNPNMTFVDSKDLQLSWNLKESVRNKGYIIPCLY